MFDEISEFTYKLTHLYNNGSHVGDTTEIEISGKANGEEQTIKYKSNEWLHDFVKLRDEIAKQVAQELAAQMAEQGSVSWTPSTTMFKDRIETTIRSGLNTSCETIGFERITYFDFKDNKLRIWIDGDSKPLIQLSTNKKNFYPGFYLFSQLMSFQRQSQNQELTIS